ncbi:MAG: sulfotransferase domain-containing protein [Wenzhouxiangella sp.]
MRARYRLLRQLQLRTLERASLMMIRHPKTGGTWLRTMLTHLYSQHYGISHKRVFKSDELRRQNAELPYWVIANGLASWERVIAESFEANKPILAGKRTIFVARHPGDIVVSWYIQFTKRTKAFKRELLEWEATQPIDRDSISREEFIKHPDFGLPWLIRYHNFWASQLKGRDDALIVRYEDLRQEPAATLRKISNFIGEQFTDQEIDDTVAFADFENMRKLESQNYFQNNSLKLRNPDDPEMRKVRRARVGGFREDLEPELCAWVEQTIELELDPVFGYGSGE